MQYYSYCNTCRCDFENSDNLVIYLLTYINICKKNYSLHAVLILFHITFYMSAIIMQYDTVLPNHYLSIHTVTII